MAKILLTDEQVEQLKKNQYVRYASSSIVSFTEEFRELFYQKRQQGQVVSRIFIECGIDPRILGEKRIEDFCYRINKHSKREGGFKLRNKGSAKRRLIHQPKSDNETIEITVKRLEHELAYTRQEVEFLKKLQIADMEARRQWESKHQPK